MSADMVCVGRDPEDARTIWVRVDQLRNPHFAQRCGGRAEALAEPALAAFMFADLIPPGVPFGFSGSHGRGRVPSIRVLVQPATDAALVERLMEMAENPKCSERARRRLEHRRAEMREES